MEKEYKCWKISPNSDPGEEKVLRVGEDTYTLQDAAGKEIRIGTGCISAWYVERKYKVQVAGLGRVYYEMRSEMQEIAFEELIFDHGQCIGAYHDELVFLFDDEKTHYRQKYLGSVPISHDQEIDYYDYYYLHANAQ